MGWGGTGGGEVVSCYLSYLGECLRRGWTEMRGFWFFVLRPSSVSLSLLLLLSIMLVVAR